MAAKWFFPAMAFMLCWIAASSGYCANATADPGRAGTSARQLSRKLPQAKPPKRRSRRCSASRGGQPFPMTRMNRALSFGNIVVKI